MWQMKSSAGGLFEVVWFVLGGLLFFIGIDIVYGSGFGEAWYHFLTGALAFGMYYYRRRMRLKRRQN
jgi:Na+/proline symporter